jgi:hypothetical protein
MKKWRRPEHADALPCLGFPVIDITKEEMMAWAEGRGLEKYLTGTHTCWRPPEPGTACGKCEMCQRRIAAVEPPEPVHYDVDVSICVPASLAIGKAETTVKSAVESILAMDVGEDRKIEIVWAGKLNAQRKTKLKKLCAVVHVDTDSTDLAYLRNAAAKEAAGHVHIHLLPGMKFKGDALAKGVIRAMQHNFWAPVPVVSGQDGTPYESTEAIPSGRGPWPLVAAPWWAFKRVGRWSPDRTADLDYPAQAQEKGVNIVRYVEDGVTFPESV